MKLQSRAKILAASAFAVVIAGAAVGTGVYHIYASEDAEIVYKETRVEKGNLTVGVTESGSVSIGTVTQDLEDLEELSDTSASSGSTSASENTGGMAGGMAAASTAGGTAKTSSSSGNLEVEEVYVTVGQVVTVGDPILKLTEKSVGEYQEKLEKAVKTAELSLKETNLSAKSSKLSAQYTYNTNVANGSVAQSEYDATISTLQAAVDSAQAAVDASAEKITDYQNRIAKGENCNAALAEEQANYNSCVSKLQSAKNEQTTKAAEAKQKYEETMMKYSNAGNLYEIDTSGIDTEIEEAQDELEEANENLQNFKALVGDGIIYAQYAGTLSSVGYEKGDTLSSSTDVAVFQNTEEVAMTVSVSQEDISTVNIGDSVEIVLTAYEDKVYEGQVESMDISSSSGTSTVSYDVTVMFTGDVSDVYQDMTGNVTFITSQVKDVLYVSNKAVLLEGTDSYVDVKRDDGTIEKQEVVTGFSDGVYVEISSGLEEGQTVLIESQVKSE